MPKSPSTIVSTVAHASAKIKMSPVSYAKRSSYARQARLLAACAIAASASCLTLAGNRPAGATPINWTNGGGTNVWSNSANWDTNSTPTNTSDVVIGSPASASTPSQDDISVTIATLTVNTGSELVIDNGVRPTVGNGTTGTIANSGVITVDDGGSVTQLNINGAVTLNGGGTINLGQTSSVGNANNGMSGSGTLTNVDNIIQGYNNNGWTLGSNAIGIVNQIGGKIIANTSGQTLWVDPNSTSGVVNTGLMEATNGGNLVLTGNGGGAFVNTDGTNSGTISAVGTGSTVTLTNGAAISNGTLSNSGGGAFYADSGSLANLTNAASFNVDNGARLTLIGTITNTGTINVNDAGNGTSLVIDSAGVTLSGGGTINLGVIPYAGGNTTNNAIGSSSGNTTVFTNVNNTIQGYNNGSWTLGSNNLDIVNQASGIIDANTAGQQLWVDPSADKGMVNTGIMEATNGGNLELTGNGGGAFVNTDGTNNGTISAIGTGSTVTLTNGAAISNGTLSNSGGGAFYADSGSLTNLTNAASFNVDNGARLTLIGTITNTGTINVNDGSSGTALVIDSAGVTLTGGGTINLGVPYTGGNTTNNAIGSSSGNTTVFTNVNNTIQGYNNNGWTLGENNLDIVNQASGIIDANTAGQQLWVDPSADKGMANAGLMEATNGGNLVLTGNGGGAFNNTGGTILATGSGTAGSNTVNSAVSLTNNAAISGGTLSSSNGGSFVVGVNDNASITNLTNAATLNADNGSRLTLVGTISNTGTINVNDGGGGTQLSIDAGGVTLTGGGTINLGVPFTGGNTANNAIGAASGTPTLTNADNTIQGYNNGGWTLGENNLDIVNQASGIIDANTAGQQLWVDPSADKGMVNTGLMEATNGGNLVLTGNGGGAFNNTGGTILATGSGTAASNTVNSAVSLTNNAAISGGTLSSSNGGSFVVGVNDNASIANLTNAATINENGGARFTLIGTINNTGTINVNDAGSGTELLIDSAGVTLTGGGTINLGVPFIGGNTNNAIGAASGTPTLTNADNTIQGYNNGSYTLGENNMAILNQGTINANTSSQTLFIDPANVANAFVNDTTGLTEATNGGILMLNGNGGGSFTNNGTFAAMDGSTFSYTDGAVLTNLSGTTLTGGIYKVIDGGHGATMVLPGSSNITTNAADVTISGVNSAFAQINTLAANQGEFRLLNNRNFTAQAGFDNQAAVSPQLGLLQLGGGTFAITSGSFTNEGTVQGFGSILPAVQNTGTVEANGGTLTLTQGVSGTGTSSTLQSDAGATLDLSGGTTSSTTQYLDLVKNGSLNLGNNNVTVSADYTNANFGIGNSFNPHANVSTTGGKILAGGNVNMGLDISNLVGGGQHLTMDFGQIHSNSTENLSYTIRNNGTIGPVLRGAIQTSANGGNITDSRLTGTGVTPQDFGGVNGLALNTSSGSYSVQFNPGGVGGSLTGQKLNIQSNFDNVGPASINITGTAYNLAQPVTTPQTITFADVHVGGTDSQNLTVKNNAPVSAFTETLAGALSAGTGNATTNDASFSGLAGGSTLPPIDALTIALDTSTAGARSGGATLSLTSNPVSGETLAATTLTPVNITASGNVYRLANPVINSPTGTTINLGVIHVGDVGTQNLSLTNNVPSDGFSENLDASLGSLTGSAFVVTNPNPVVLTPGSTNTVGSLQVGVSTATPGLNKTGTATLNLISDGTGIDTLGTTTLTPIVYTINATVNNYALPTILLQSGSSGAVLHEISSTQYSLKLGTTTQGASNLFANLGFGNGATGPSDTVAGNFTLNAASFNLTGFNNFSGIGAGQNTTGQDVTLSDITAGTFSGSITYNPFGQNSSGYNSPFSPITINLSGTVNSSTPEPTTLALLAVGSLGLLVRRRKTA